MSKTKIQLDLTLVDSGCIRKVFSLTAPDNQVGGGTNLDHKS